MQEAESQKKIGVTSICRPEQQGARNEPVTDKGPTFKQEDKNKNRSEKSGVDWLTGEVAGEATRWRLGSCRPRIRRTRETETSRADRAD